MRPARVWWMVSPAPQASTCATASPGPGSGSGTVSRTNGVFRALSTIAFTSIPLRGSPPRALFAGLRVLEVEPGFLHGGIQALLAVPVCLGEAGRPPGRADALDLLRIPA